MRKELKQKVKRLLYFVVFNSGLLSLVIVVAKRLRKKYPILILFYHRFHDKKEREAILPSVHVDEFEKQIRYLKKAYDLISMDDVVETLQRGGRFSRPSVVITIDDGYLNNYTLAYPILRRFGVPAMIYLTTGVIGTDRGQWVDEIEYAFLHSCAQSIDLAGIIGAGHCDLSSHEKKKDVASFLYKELLHQTNEVRERVISGLHRILGQEHDKARRVSRTMLDWSEVLEMAKNGISFGAHTVSHPFLPGMPYHEAIEEIRESKDTIERKIRQQVKHFAIPNGRAEDFTDDLRRACENLGFSSVVTTEAGVVSSGESCLNLKRLSPSPPLYYFACETALFLVFGRKVRDARARLMADGRLGTEIRS